MSAFVASATACGVGSVGGGAGGASGSAFFRVRFGFSAGAAGGAGSGATSAAALRMASGTVSVAGMGVATGPVVPAAGASGATTPSPTNTSSSSCRRIVPVWPSSRANERPPRVRPTYVAGTRPVENSIRYFAFMRAAPALIVARLGAAVGAGASSASAWASW